MGCASAAAQGGRCGAGALSGGVGSFAGPFIPENLGFTGRLTATAAIGGTASVLGGGKFANGAVTASFGYLFNEMAGYWENTVVPERGDAPGWLQFGLSFTPGVDLINALNDPNASGWDYVIGAAGVVPGAGKVTGLGVKGGRWVIKAWDKASFRTVSDSVRYHYSKHGIGEGIELYTQKALDLFTNHANSGKQITLSNGDMGIKIKTSTEFGIYSQNGKIISYGPK